MNAPEYVFLISQLAGEQRFASIVAKRLESLGALTHGDRRATESRDLSKYNVDTKVCGDQAGSMYSTCGVYTGGWVLPYVTIGLDDLGGLYVGLWMYVGE